MAFYDAPLQLSTAQAVVASAASTLIYDVTGAGSGNAPAMVFGQTAAGAPALGGFDIGGGMGASQPKAVFDITTTGTGTGTIAFGVEAAIDNGSNAPGTYVRLATSGAKVGTTLIAGDKIIIPIPPEVIKAIGELKPRFYRFFYDQTGDGAVSVTSTIQINPEMGLMGNVYSNNFVAA
jgi:hypothetical protein